MVMNELEAHMHALKQELDMETQEIDKLLTKLQDKKIGVKKIEDLEHVDKEDWEEFGISRVQKNKILKSVNRPKEESKTKTKTKLS